MESMEFHIHHILRYNLKLCPLISAFESPHLKTNSKKLGQPGRGECTGPEADDLVLISYPLLSV